MLFFDESGSCDTFINDFPDPVAAIFAAVANAVFVADGGRIVGSMAWPPSGRQDFRCEMARRAGRSPPQETLAVTSRSQLLRAGDECRAGLYHRDRGQEAGAGDGLATLRWFCGLEAGLGGGYVRSILCSIQWGLDSCHPGLGWRYAVRCGHARRVGRSEQYRRFRALAIGLRKTVWIRPTHLWFCLFSLD